jgi:hypothetical protein
MVSKLAGSGLRRVFAGVALGASGLAPAAAAAAQPVLLEVRPTAGDTIRLRLEQTVEMKGTTRVGKRDSTMSSTSRMAILARAIVLSTDSAGARILAITDSVVFEGAQGLPSSPYQRDPRSLEGAKVEMRLLPDGSSDILPADSEVMNDFRALMAQMPSTLPRTPVQVGERWSSVVSVPIAGQGGVARTESLKMTFRFDSLSRNREIAHISMVGEISRRASDSAKGPAGTEMTGTIRGGMTVDRKRGWMTDSRAVVTIRSVVAPPPGSRAGPMRFELAITQRMRALDKR